MTAVPDKNITVVYRTADPSARTTVTLGMASPFATEHIVSLLFDDIYMDWWYAGLPISGWNDFAFPLSSDTEQFEVRFKSLPTGVLFPPMPYVVSSAYAPSWAKAYGNIRINASVDPVTNISSWLAAWLRPWKIFGV